MPNLVQLGGARSHFGFQYIVVAEIGQTKPHEKKGKSGKYPINIEVRAALSGGYGTPCPLVDKLIKFVYRPYESVLFLMIVLAMQNMAGQLAIGCTLNVELPSRVLKESFHCVEGNAFQLHQLVRFGPGFFKFGALRRGEFDLLQPHIQGDPDFLAFGSGTGIAHGQVQVTFVMAWSCHLAVTNGKRLPIHAFKLGVAGNGIGAGHTC